MTETAATISTALPVLGLLVPLGLLALAAIARAIVTVARDGYRRAPEQHPVIWYQRTDALGSRPTSSR